MNRASVLVALAALATVPLFARPSPAQQYAFQRPLRFTFRPSPPQPPDSLHHVVGPAPSAPDLPSISAMPAQRPDCAMPVFVPDLSRFERMPGSHAPAPDVVAQVARTYCYNPLGPARRVAARP